MSERMQRLVEHVAQQVAYSIGALVFGWKKPETPTPRFREVCIRIYAGDPMRDVGVGLPAMAAALCEDIKQGGVPVSFVEPPRTKLGVFLATHVATHPATGAAIRATVFLGDASGWDLLTVSYACDGWTPPVADDAAQPEVR